MTSTRPRSWRYPLRLDRGKQPEKAVRLFAELEGRRTVRAAHRRVLPLHGGPLRRVPRGAPRRGAPPRAHGRRGRDHEQARRAAGHRRRGHGSLSRRAAAQGRDGPVPPDERVRPPVGVETYSLCARRPRRAARPVPQRRLPPMRDLHGADAVDEVLLVPVPRPTSRASRRLPRRGPRGRPRDSEQRAVRQKTRLRRTRNLGAVFRDHLEPLLYDELTARPGS